MIKKSIIIAVILVVCYEAFVRISKLPSETSQNDKSSNIISAQDYIFNVPLSGVKNDTVIVGSSMSRKLIADSLGPDFYNLSFNAWSSFDGLQVIRLTKKVPACILIETNVVGEQIMQEGITSSLSPVSKISMNIFKSFQLKNQPVGLMVGSIKESLKAKIESLKKLKRENTELYDNTVAMTVELQSKTLEDSVYVNRFATLQKLVENFKQQGVEVVFFELPVDKKLENTALNQTHRAYFKKYFPTNEYKYINLPPVNDFVFSDGTHLEQTSALRFTLYIKNALQKINQDKVAL